MTTHFQPESLVCVNLISPPTCSSYNPNFMVMNVREKRVLAMLFKVVPRMVKVLPKIKYVKGSSGYSFNPRKLRLNMPPNVARVQLIVCKTITQKHH